MLVVMSAGVAEAARVRVVHTRTRARVTVTVRPGFPLHRTLPAVVVRTGPVIRVAPRAYLASAPESYSYLHFVAHGVATRQRPLDSAVILARDRDGYKLYAREILAHPLKARLVTISSCHGAGKRAFEGEGLVGLAWAFLGAGAHEVIAALWEVNDAATPELMDTMYASSATSSWRRCPRSNSVYRKPLYWAPFVLYSGS